MKRLLMTLAVLFVCSTLSVPVAFANTYGTGTDSFVYVANEFTNTVDVIRVSDHVRIASVPAGATPFGVAVSPDGNTLYVSNTNSQSISVIDTRTNSLKTTIAVGSSPQELTFTPDEGVRLTVEG
jgi:YVTN family beta-propeller protein